MMFSNIRCYRNHYVIKADNDNLSSSFKQALLRIALALLQPYISFFKNLSVNLITLITFN